MTNFTTLNLTVTLNINKMADKPSDDRWQEECRQLYSRLKEASDSANIEPLKIRTEGDTYRGDFLEIFSTLTASIASIGGLSVIIDIVKLWLEHRKGSEVILKFPDGSEMKISDASKEEILKLYEAQLAKQK